MKTTNIMIVGVGGQGSLLASKLLGNLLVDEGYDVCLADVYLGIEIGISLYNSVAGGKTRNVEAVALEGG